MSTNSLMFIWLDKRAGSLPGGNDRMKEKFRQLLNPLKQFDKPTLCEDQIVQSLKEKKIFFITSSSFVDRDFLKKICSLPQIVRLYIFDATNSTHFSSIDDKNLKLKMGEQRIIQFDEHLYEQILQDLIEFYSNLSLQMEKEGNRSQAKDLLQHTLKYFHLFQEKDSDLIQLEENLRQRLEKLC